MTQKQRSLRRNKNEDDSPQHRRSRLWLSDSTDNLRDSYTLPDDYRNPDELAAPTPIEHTHDERRQGYLDDYNADSEDDNLDETAAPSPVENTHQHRRQGSLEDQHAGSENNLDEVAAPSPIEDRQNEQGQEKSEEGANSPPQQGVSKLATEIYTISYLVFFSIIGTLCRLGLQALTLYPGAPVQFGVLWANVGGSLIMGLLSEDRKLFREEWGTPSSPKETTSHDEEKHISVQRSPSAGQRHAAIKKTIPLYIGLATGFCGSFTSFSSFMRDSFFALSNILPVPISHPSTAPISPTVDVHRNPGYSFMAVLAILITTVGLCIGALQTGAHLALAIEPFAPSIPFVFLRKVVDRSVVLLAMGSWLGAIFLAIWPPDRPGGPLGKESWAQEMWRTRALFALVFAPLGCLLRFYASLLLNGRIKSFPLGTFAVNIFGTLMEAVFLDLQRVPVGGMVGCQVLQGMSDGFCGCLTTVSTWVAELKGLRTRHAYFYGLMSVGVALGLMVIVMGISLWTVGFRSVQCMP